MPLTYQTVLTQTDARVNPRNLYVFSDNVRRKKIAGPDFKLSTEPNAIGIATQYSPFECFGDTPEEILAQNRIIDEDMKPLFEHVKKGGIVVWPHRGIGTGAAALPVYAPTTFAYLREKLAALIRVAELFDRGRIAAAEAEAKSHDNNSKDIELG